MMKKCDFTLIGKMYHDKSGNNMVNPPQIGVKFHASPDVNCDKSPNIALVLSGAVASGWAGVIK